MQDTAPYTILGIDPGTNFMGYGLLRVEGKKATLVEMGVLMLNRLGDAYTKLARILETVNRLCEAYHPTHLSIEAQFYGPNPQSMLKLGRAQGVAIAAARAKGLEITEYAPAKIKMAITGNGKAEKEQLAFVLQRALDIPEKYRHEKFDATDALGAAYCHYLQLTSPLHAPTTARSTVATQIAEARKQAQKSTSHVRGASSWDDFLKKNPNRIKKS